ncbi:MAG: site-specific DNA-methyltransferase [Prosthecobacter sp.]|nr:site-specific DNA-methyltransferase [Prosthecobacter sp.]
MPFHLLKDVPELGSGDPGSGNLIVEGDNLLALKALLPYYKGKVKCIYIDPPYNTGNEGWVYNDNVKSPAIKKWLGETVGKEGETLDRHDRWLCMMYPRLALLREFLREDGVILISLDEVEIAVLKLILDELFGKQNALGTIVWNTRNTDNRIKTHLSPDHEYVVVYGKSEHSRIEGRIIDRSDFKNPDNDPRGPYVTDPLTGKATAEARPNLHAYNMAQPGTTNVWKPDPAYGWITDEAGYKELLQDSRIWWPPNPRSGKPRKKRFLSETKVRMPASSFWTEFKTFSGARDLDEILDERVFAFPKPVPVVQRVIDYCAPPGSIVLDSFGGSGTTAHALLKQNAEDGGGRRFILVEMEPKIAQDITRERVKRVAEGYTDANGDAVSGLGGGFRYVRLGEAVFDEHQRIRESVRFADLARHVYFTETGEPLPKERVSAKTPLLGIHHGRAVYLLYNGILKDRSIDGGNALCRETLAVIQEHNAAHSGIEQTVVYGTSERLSKARQKREGIVFKQIPYSIRDR